MVFLLTGRFTEEGLTKEKKWVVPDAGYPDHPSSPDCSNKTCEEEI